MLNVFRLAKSFQNFSSKIKDDWIIDQPQIDHLQTYRRPIDHRQADQQAKKWLIDHLLYKSTTNKFTTWPKMTKLTTKPKQTASNLAF